MYQAQNICYGINDRRDFTFLYKTPIYYIDIFNDKICNDTVIIKNFDINVLLAENGLESLMRTAYNKEDLLKIMDKLLIVQDMDIDN